MRRAWRAITLPVLLAACSIAEPPVSPPPVLATPAPPPPPPEPPKPVPEDLIGLTPAVVQQTLGTPSLVRREGSAQVMQFRSSDCVFDVTFYEDDEDRYFRADHIAARRPDGSAFAAQACLISVLPDGVWPAGFRDHGDAASPKVTGSGATGSETTDLSQPR